MKSLPERWQQISRTELLISLCVKGHVFFVFGKRRFRMWAKQNAIVNERRFSFLQPRNARKFLSTLHQNAIVPPLAIFAKGLFSIQDTITQPLFNFTYSLNVYLKVAIKLLRTSSLLFFPLRKLFRNWRRNAYTMNLHVFIRIIA
jgi:hypothetical protein